MSTRAVIARQNGSGFVGVYHHWDGYPEGLGCTLFNVHRTIFAGDTERMLKYLIDLHPAGWSTINKDWSKRPRVDQNEQVCQECGKLWWQHYRQYYHPPYSAEEIAPNAWERAGRPAIPDGEGVLVLGHPAKVAEVETGPEPSSGDAMPMNERNASDCGCEYAYVFDARHHMHIMASYCAEDGAKMIGMFGCGDPKATWKDIAVVDLNGKEPNWQCVCA